MKKYIKPEAEVLQVIASKMICSSANADRTGFGEGYGIGGGVAPAIDFRDDWDD